jgi:hypothetical protein
MWAVVRERDMIRDRLERIRERAYALWERAGGSHGQHEAHWHQASSEIDAEDAPSRAKPARKAAAKPAAAASKAASPAKTPAKTKEGVGVKAKAATAIAAKDAAKVKAAAPKPAPRAKSAAAKPAKSASAKSTTGKARS